MKYERKDSFHLALTHEAQISFIRIKDRLKEDYDIKNNSEVIQLLIKEYEKSHIPKDDLSLKRLKLMSKYIELL